MVIMDRAMPGTAMKPIVRRRESLTVITVMITAEKRLYWKNRIGGPILGYEVSSKQRHRGKFFHKIRKGVDRL
jgi:hypothetical protein